MRVVPTLMIALASLAALGTPAAAQYYQHYQPVPMTAAGPQAMAAPMYAPMTAPMYAPPGAAMGAPYPVGYGSMQAPVYYDPTMPAGQPAMGVQPIPGFVPGQPAMGVQPIPHTAPAWNAPGAMQPAFYQVPAPTSAEPLPVPDPAAAQSTTSQQLAASVGLAPRGNACLGCATPGCTHCCGGKCQCGHCGHRWQVFGDWLFLSTSGGDMAFGVPQDGIGGPGTVPRGEVGSLSDHYRSGFRTGLSMPLGCDASLTATLTWFQATAYQEINSIPGQVVQPLVMFPGTINAGSTSQRAEADNRVEFQLGDLDYLSVIDAGCHYHLNYLIGIRYANLDQRFAAVFPFATPDGRTRVDTDINFEGIGLRMGIDGQRELSREFGWGMYSRLVGSLLAGEVGTSYVQTNQLNGIEALTTWKENRIVPVAEWELGLRWSSVSGHLHASAGYYVAWWGNTVTTPEYVNAVQNLNFTDVGQDATDALVFDGLVSRIEWRR